MIQKKPKPIFFVLLVLVVFLFPGFRWIQKNLDVADFKKANEFFEKGEYYFLTGDYKTAEKEFLKSLEALPQHADALFFMAQIEYKKENRDKALEHITNAENNYESFTKVKLKTIKDSLERLQIEKRDAHGMLDDLRRALAQTNIRQETQLIRSQIEQQEKSINIIDIRMDKLVSEETREEVNSANYHYVHGNVLFKKKSYKEALGKYLEAVKIDPSHGNAYNNLANLYYMDKQYQKALDCLIKAEENGFGINPEFKQAVLKALGK